MDGSSGSDSGPSAIGRQSSSPSGAAASGAAVATPPRRTTPQRSTKTNAAHARTSNRFFVEKLHGQVPGRSEYTRVVLYETNPHFDEEAAKTCGPEDIGQCVAKLLKDTGHWNVWRHEDGYFVTFNTSSSSFHSIYGIDSLETGIDKFSSYEALGKWARGESGFFREKILHSSDDMVQRFVEQMGLSEAEESGGPSNSSARGKVRKGKNYGRKRMAALISASNDRRRDDASSDESEGEDNRGGGNYKTTGESDFEDEDDEEEGRESSAFFSPRHTEETEVDRSKRSCVKAVCTFLGSEKEVGHGTQCVKWDGILREISPEGAVIRSFESAAELAELPRGTRDRIYAATVTRKKANAHHAMVLWKEKHQLGTTKMMLYDPGSEIGKTRRIVDMCNRRIISSDWSGICAIFVPGTQVEKRDVEVIAISSSGEEEEEPAKKRSGRGPRKSNEASSEASSTASVSESPIVSDGDLKNLFNTINGRFKSSATATATEKQFYGHLRTYMSTKSSGLLVSEFNRIQEFVGSFESIMEEAKTASDNVEVNFCTGRAQRVVRECEEELLVMNVKSEEN
ncbi:hypothetical protein ACHAXT_009558 [Thalassiosira profunda]